MMTVMIDFPGSNFQQKRQVINQENDSEGLNKCNGVFEGYIRVREHQNCWPIVIGTLGSEGRLSSV